MIRHDTFSHTSPDHKKRIFRSFAAYVYMTYYSGNNIQKEFAKSMLSVFNNLGYRTTINFNDYYNAVDVISGGKPYRINSSRIEIIGYNIHFIRSFIVLHSYIIHSFQYF